MDTRLLLREPLFAFWVGLDGKPKERQTQMGMLFEERKSLG